MTATLLDKPEPGTAGAEQQVVALHLGDEIYGVDIACIHTVLTLQPITPLPNVPAAVRGVMNLRGRILPVLDLRTRFGLAPLAADGQKSARIVIVEAGDLMAGLIVDSVSEVMRLSAEAIEAPSALLGSAEGRCLTGIGRVPGKSGAEGERLLLLLDIAQTLLPVERNMPSPALA